MVVCNSTIVSFEICCNSVTSFLVIFKTFCNYVISNLVREAMQKDKQHELFKVAFNFNQNFSVMFDNFLFHKSPAFCCFKSDIR